MSQTALKTFIVYAREDKPHLDRFLMHLRILERNGLLDVWHDAEIPVGAHWEQAIKEQLHLADIILILVTVNALNSEFIENEEMAAAFVNLQAGTSRVVPIIVDHCLWKDHPKISALQGLPEDMRPVTDSSNPNQVWAAVSEGVRQIALDMLKSREPAPQAAAVPTPVAPAVKTAPVKKAPAAPAAPKKTNNTPKNAPKTTEKAASPDEEAFDGTVFSILTGASLAAGFLFFAIHYAIRVYMNQYLTPGGYWTTILQMALYSALGFTLATVLVLSFHNWVSRKMTTMLMVLVLCLPALDLFQPFYHWYAFDNGMLKINGVSLLPRQSDGAVVPEKKTTMLPSSLQNAHPKIQELYTFLAQDGNTATEYRFTIPASQLFVKGYLTLSETLLSDLCSVLKTNSYRKLKIEVYSDNLGDPRANKSLTEKRAAALQQRLLSLGVPTSALECIGLGGISPVATNTDEAGREQNRRVVFVVQR